MQDADEEIGAVPFDRAPDWTPWGQPRLAAEGVETAFHHTLILVRENGGPPRLARPGDIFAGPALEWSPAMWALAGRRPGRGADSLEEARVFAGADERLFSTIDSVCEQIFEGAGLSDASRDRWIAALEARVAFCAARGILYRQLVVPDAHALYADAIPGAPRLSPERPWRRLWSAASETLRACLVYPLDALIDGRATAETSLPHDVHVSRYGALLMYRALMASLPGFDPASWIALEDLKARTVLHAGDVARAAGLPARRVVMHERPPFAFTSPVKGDSYRTLQVDVLESDAPGPGLVMFRTSNASLLFPFLLKHFSRIAAVASREAFYDLIESERPAVVVGELPERYLAKQNDNENIPDFGAPPHDLLDGFEALTGHKLPLPRGENT